jgi:glycosyltransferase involved in cell wall biosynthesis
VADEADEVVVASPDLAYLFPGRMPVHVPNGAEAGDVAERAVPAPRRRTAVYVGTLSERFDVPTVAEVLAALPEWSLDIYGPCRYAGLGDRPSAELQDLLAGAAGRARYHGPIPRSAVAAAIDSADVTLVPNVSRLSVGQSSMKVFDSAARGRPAVVAHGVTSDGDGLPPSTVVAATTDEWVAGILGSLEEPACLAQERIDWARANTWEHRWPTWSRAVFGAVPVGGSRR